MFYEGPPTANGLPHPGHCLTRAIKDLFPRYRTMRGYLCKRKGGWDTHGLPVEVEVCKELGIHSKEEIEAYGVEPFIHKCLQSVFRYTKEWEELTERLGFWIRLDEAYVTYHQSYVESVWWALKNLFDRGLLYQGHKIVWWWAQGGTAPSAAKWARATARWPTPASTCRFPLGRRWRPDRRRPAGLDHHALDAAEQPVRRGQAGPGVRGRGGRGRARASSIMASALVETIAAKVGKKFDRRVDVPGRGLLGRRYRAAVRLLLQDAGPEAGPAQGDGGTPARRLARGGGRLRHHRHGHAASCTRPRRSARSTTTCCWPSRPGSSTGEGPPLICSVAPDGTFTAEAPEYQGRWVKDADRDIIRGMRDRGLLFHQEQYLHDYPFCWRAEEDPLIQYPRRSWFIRTTQFKEKMLANNARINWLPGHIRDGRFGNFLETNVDWALSRERYWGTPLPIWVCEKTGYMEAVASYEELLAKPGVEGTDVWEKAKKANPDLPDDLKVHKPYIDAITYDSPKAKGARMRRVPEVIDCWFDSGAMPFAQWGYPGQQGSEERFLEQFPADFISEALDQTRGWFYSLLAISTLLFSEEYPHPYRNCIVLGLMLSEWWEAGKQVFLSEDDARKEAGGKYHHRVGKMSKQLRNYRAPQEIFTAYGADALRWYFFANQPPWNSIIYSEKAIRENIPEFLLRLWNVYSFFVIYANIDGFDPAAAIAGDAGQLGPEVLAAGRGLPAARRARRAGPLGAQRAEPHGRRGGRAHGRLRQLRRLHAPDRVPRRPEQLVRAPQPRPLLDGPAVGRQDRRPLDALRVPGEHLQADRAVRAVRVRGDLAEPGRGGPGRPRAPERPPVRLPDRPGRGRRRGALRRAWRWPGRSSRWAGQRRMGAKLKVRQPLARVEVVLADAAHAGVARGARRPGARGAERQAGGVHPAGRPVHQLHGAARPEAARAALGKRLPALRKLLATADAAKLLAEMESAGKVTLDLPDGPVELDSDDLQVRMQAKPGWAAAQGRVLRRGALHRADRRPRGRRARPRGRARRAEPPQGDRLRVHGPDSTLRSSVGQLLSKRSRFRGFIKTETLCSYLEVYPESGAPGGKRIAGTGIEDLVQSWRAGCISEVRLPSPRT